MAQVERYGPGEEPDHYSPGDFILAHRHRPFPGLISQAEKRHFRGLDAPFAHWSHTAIVVGGDGAIVEAEMTGVTLSPISKYRSGEYHLVRIGPDFAAGDRERAVEYAVAQVGHGFGYLAMFGAGLYLVFGWPLRLMRRNHQICSGLVVRALQKGGQVQDLDPDLSLPADLARRFDALP